MGKIKLSPWYVLLFFCFTQALYRDSIIGERSRPSYLIEAMRAVEFLRGLGWVLGATFAFLGGSKVDTR